MRVLHWLWFSLILAGQSPVHGTETLSLLEGELLVLSQSQAPTRVAVARPEVVDARVVGDQEIVLLGLTPGMTSVVWWLENGERHQREVRIRSRLSEALSRELEQHLVQLPEVQVVDLGDAVYLMGQVTPAAAEALQQLANRYEHLRLEQLEIVAQPAELLELEVQVMEFKKRYLRQLGIRWQPAANGPAVGILSDWRGGGSLRVLADDSANWIPEPDMLAMLQGSGSQVGWLGLHTSLQSTLQMLEEQGIGRILATPVLRVESGQEAEFLVGGEIPLPQLSAQGAPDIHFRDYGIRLQVQPELLAGEQIRTALVSELSNPDHAVAVQGIPGLQTRRTQSVVNSQAGETMVLSGLLSSEENRQRSGLPGVGHLPGLGSMFAGREESVSSTELVVFITPRRVSQVEEQRRQHETQLQKYWQQLASSGCRGIRE